MIYVFDTSSFIRLNSYYPDIFPGFGSSLMETVAAGEIVSTREVLRELEREEPDHAFAWEKQNAAFSLPRPAPKQVCWTYSRCSALPANYRHQRAP